jgi:hypothetical protein
VTRPEQEEAMRNLWRDSILFRRVVAALSVTLAALAVYLVSNIRQAASLPNEAIDKLAVAHSNEELRVNAPQLKVGDAALSFEGAPNVGAEVWLQNAKLAGNSLALFGALAPQQPTRVVYAADAQDAKAANKNCRTSLIISRADGTGEPQLLRLWQDGSRRADQGFRELVVSSPETEMEVQVSTDSLVPGMQCPRLLTMGTKVIKVPIGPIHLSVPANQTITLLFSAIDPTQTLFSTRAKTFDGLSLGDGDLKAGGFDVVSSSTEKTPLLHVVAHKGTGGITLHDLKLGAESATISVGNQGEKADSWANGKGFPVLNLLDIADKNRVLSSLLGAVLLPGLWAWIKKTCFPKSASAKSEDAEPETT